MRCLEDPIVALPNSFKLSQTIFRAHSTPIPVGFGSHFQSAQQRRELFPAQRGRRSGSFRPAESAALEPFGANPQATAIPIQELDSITGPIGKQKEVSA